MLEAVIIPQESRCLWNRYNIGWPCRCERSSSWTMPTTGSLGIKLSEYICTMHPFLCTSVLTTKGIHLLYTNVSFYYYATVTL
jgi:hypothetical protein